MKYVDFTMVGDFVRMISRVFLIKSVLYRLVILLYLWLLDPFCLNAIRLNCASVVLVTSTAFTR